MNKRPEVAFEVSFVDDDFAAMEDIGLLSFLTLNVRYLFAACATPGFIV
jgi:hypothetical protein